MLVLRCTRKPLARLKQPDNLADVESTTRLGDWYGNILQLGRRQHLLFISDRSRLWGAIPVGDVPPSTVNCLHPRQQPPIITVERVVIGRVFPPAGALPDKRRARRNDPADQLRTGSVLRTCSPVRTA